MAITPNFILYVAGETSLPVLAGLVDGYPDETHKIKVSKTRFPLEDGKTLTDHAVREPNILELSGWTSDIIEPISGERPAKAWEKLQSLSNARTMLEVHSPIGSYSNMLIVEAETTRSQITGKSLQFTLKLEEVQIIGAESGSLAPGTTGSAVAGRTTAVNRGLVQPGSNDRAAALNNHMNRVRRAQRARTGSPEHDIEAARNEIGEAENWPDGLARQLIGQAPENTPQSGLQLLDGDGPF